MDISSVLLAVAGQLAIRLPMWIAWIVAVAIAITRWKQHPRVSQLVVTAIGILALEALVGAIVTMSAPLYLMRSGGGPTQLGIFYTVYGFLTGCVSAGCWAMLIAAIFGWRGGQSDARGAASGEG